MEGKAGMAQGFEEFPFLGEIQSRLSEVIRQHVEELAGTEFLEAHARGRPLTLARIDQGDFCYAVIRLHRPPGRLSDAQRKIALLVSDGLANKDIANKLGVKTPTVASQIGRMYRKLKVRSRAELACLRPWYS